MAKEKAKEKLWFLTLDGLDDILSNYEAPFYIIHHRCDEPSMSHDTTYPLGRFNFTIPDFHALSPLRLNPGECVKINEPKLSV